jgi:hypothetical protein
VETPSSKDNSGVPLLYCVIVVRLGPVVERRLPVSSALRCVAWMFQESLAGETEGKGSGPVVLWPSAAVATTSTQPAPYC